MAKKVNKSEKQKNNLTLYIILGVILVSVAGYIIYSNMQKPNIQTNGQKDNFITGKEMIKFNKEGELTFHKASGGFVSIIDIEIAEDDSERENGLMMRFSMEEKQGMLFIFDQERIQSFWMRNTFMPLDMIFVNKNNEIVTIHKNTAILSDQSYRSTAPALYVVEVQGGYTDKYNLQEGDKIVWRRI